MYSYLYDSYFVVLIGRIAVKCNKASLRWLRKYKALLKKLAADERLRTNERFVSADYCSVLRRILLPYDCLERTSGCGTGTGKM